MCYKNFLLEAEEDKACQIDVIEDNQKEDNEDGEDGEDGGGQYSYRGTTSLHVRIEGIKVVKHGDLVSPFTPKKGVKYFLVYTTYDQSDSFGSDETIAYDALCKTKEGAKKIIDAIDHAVDKAKDRVAKAIKVEADGYEYELYVSHYTGWGVGSVNSDYEEVSI